MPQQEGKWNYLTASNDKKLNNKNKLREHFNY